MALQDRLRTLCLERAAGRKSITDFLRGVGHNIRWKGINRQNQEGQE